ncbi:TonB-dependent receptor [Xylophilus sp.]|uniref:TonB-dependent receptor n=1 Tax=Xylophilus sp. TaxID=2653893 RepID=UPI003FCD74D5
MSPLSLAVLMAAAAPAQAQQAASSSAGAADATLSTVTVNASADASAEGLTKPYAGGQVARGGRVGLLGTQDTMDTPFSITSYTSELIQNQQARSVADVLQNDPAVRVARGYGNFQETYFIRGFILSSDDVAYNGLYGLMPRQYTSAELFERVEVLRGASAFLSGATPSGGGIGGNINLLPKRAPNEPLNRITVGVASGGQPYAAADVARRFGPDQSTGIRVNLAHRQGDTAVDGESVGLNVASVGLDWRSRRARLSADVGYQNYKLNGTRPSVTLSGVTDVPAAPKNTTNYAQPWTHSYERDVYSTVRGEYDFSDSVTGWFAAGARKADENNRLAGVTVTDASTGDGTTYRYDNHRKDTVKTAEFSLRGKFDTGAVKHTVVGAFSYYGLHEKNAYVMDYWNTLSTNIYSPASHALPAVSGSAYAGGDLANPGKLSTVRLTSLALGDTLSLLDGNLLATLGLRHQKLSSTSYNYSDVMSGTPYDESRTSPVAGIVFKLRPGLSVYGNYIEGLSAGENITGTYRNAGTSLPPYVSKQKEVGVKYDGGRFGGSLAFFSTDKPGKLVVDNTVTANGKDRHQGLELTTYGEPARGLRVLGGVTFLDAKQKDTGSSTTEGRRVIGVPRQQGNIGVEWDVPPLRGLTVDARVVATASSYADNANTLRVPGWARLDLGVRYLTEFNGKLLTLRGRVDNVADRSYWSSVGGYPGNGYLVLAAPRTFTVSASVDF